MSYSYRSAAVKCGSTSKLSSSNRHPQKTFRSFSSPSPGGNNNNSRILITTKSGTEISHKGQQLEIVLRQAICSVLSKNVASIRPSFESLYRAAYKIVSHKRGHLLYGSLSQVLLQHLHEVKTLIITQTAKSNCDLIKALDVAFKDFSNAMEMIRDILLYLDSVYVVPNKLQPVYDLGMTLFRDIVLQDPFIESQLKLVVDKDDLAENFASFLEASGYPLDGGRERIDSDSSNDLPNNKKVVRFSLEIDHVNSDTAENNNNNNPELSIITPDDSLTSSPSSSPTGSPKRTGGGSSINITANNASKTTLRETVLRQ